MQACQSLPVLLPNNAPAVFSRSVAQFFVMTDPTRLIESDHNVVGKHECKVCHGPVLPLCDIPAMSSTARTLRFKGGSRWGRNLLCCLFLHTSAAKRGAETGRKNLGF